MAKTKICLGCYQSFIGRRNARACSARCRKRLQRTRELILQETKLKTTSSQMPTRAAKAGVLSVWLIFCGLGLLIALAGQGLALSKGYITNDKNLKTGMAVSITPGSSETNPAVQVVNYKNADKVIGIVVELGDDLVTEVPQGSQVYVEQSGQAKAYVSDLNGKVKKGDLLTLSPLSGVLMRSSDRSVTTIGTAIEDFSDGSVQAVQATNANNDPVNSQVSLININIDIQPASPKELAENSNNVLDKLSFSLTGRKVNGLRVLAALAVFSTLLVIEGEIIYGTITSSIIAMGRNPLARGLIGRQSLRGIGVGILMLIVGSASIGALLWL